METIDYDPALMTSDVGDAKLHVQFYMSFVPNEVKSAEAGHPKFDDVPFTKIFTPGDRTNVIDRPTRPSDKMRFPQQWARFQQNQEQRADGMPISEWPIVTRGQAEELKFMGFTTVEQIANAHDGTKLMGLQDLKNKAKVYLETAKGNTAPTEQMMAKLGEIVAQNKVLSENLVDAQAKIKALEQSLLKKAA